MYKYNLVATGGTFDRFHKGHEALLDKAFEVGEKVIIGVTSDRMVRKEPKVLKETVLSYRERVNELKKYLKKRGFLKRSIIEKLNDVYGPTVINGEVSAVVCTRETRKGASEINKKRARLGKKRLAVVECPFITSSDGYHISSTRIRLGEINRRGAILTKQSFGKKLPENLRTSLKKPIDKLFNNVREVLNEVKNPVILITIGDAVYQELKRLGRKSDIAVIDLKIGRKNKFLRDNLFQADYLVKNQAGTVSKSLIQTLKKAVRDFLSRKERPVIRVIGEEDLAVIPAILVSPLQSIILYGQPALKNVKGGIVRVVVTEEKKEWAVSLLRKFK